MGVFEYHCSSGKFSKFWLNVVGAILSGEKVGSIWLSLKET